MRRVRSILLPVAVIVALALTVTMAGSVFAGGRPLSAELTGAAEVPPASPTGGGHVELTVNPGTGEICYSLTVSGIGTPVASHIHIGFADQAGPVVVPLATPTSGSSSGCVTIAPSKAHAIVASPQAFYVNVHTAEFPAGAIRGQLG